MEVRVKIERGDIGFQYESIKSLLKKFSVIEKNRSKINKLEVSIDFEPKQFHELGGALVWRLMRHYQDLPCKDKSFKYTPRIKPELERRHFFDRLTGRKSGDNDRNIPFHFESFAPLRDVSETTDGVTAEDVYESAMSGVLEKGNPFHSEVKINISEVINNVFDHSELKNDAGIVSVKSDTGMLSICTVDMGQGIKKSFLSNPALKDDYIGLSDEECIERATKFHVSCNPSVSRHPNYKETRNAGIGLYFLKNFIRMHKGGQLVILSQKGYYYTDSTGKEVKKNFVDVAWPGVLVYFRVDMGQSVNPDYIELAQHG